MERLCFPLVGSKLQVWGRNPPADGLRGAWGAPQIQRVSLFFLPAGSVSVTTLLKQVHLKGRFFLMKNSTEGNVFMSVMLIFICRKRYFYCPLYLVIYYVISGAS